MTFLAKVEQHKLAHESGIERPAALNQSRVGLGDSVIVIQMGPDQVPAVARIVRSAWPSVSALNFNEGQEFHVRLRRHKVTGVCLVYCSISWDDAKHPRFGPDGKKLPRPPSIHAEVVQRGRLCRNQSQFEAAVADIRRELGIGARILGE